MCCPQVTGNSSRRWQPPVQESIRFLEVSIRRRSYIRVKISTNDYNRSISQPRRPLTVIAWRSVAARELMRCRLDGTGSSSAEGS